MNSPYLSLLQLTDLHIFPAPEITLLGINTEYYFNRVLQHAFMQSIDYDAILISGDLAQSPCRSTYQRLLHQIEEFNLPTMCLPGNHDDFELMQEVLDTPLVSCKKQVIFGCWQLVILNSQILKSEGGYLEQTELDFLEKCLAENTSLFTLIATHHNCLPSDSKWLDTMQISNSDEFLAIVARYPNVKVITTGHIHQEMDKKFGDVAVYGTPSTCFQFAKNSVDFAMDRTPPGYRIIKLHDNGEVTSEVHRIDTVLSELEITSEGY